MTPPPLIVIGASNGGVNALLDVTSALPRDFPAILAVTLHVGTQPSILPELLTRRGPNPAMHAEDGLAPQPGTIYVAPPDRHLLVEPGQLRLSRGPRENHTRPAIDPLFRTAAIHWHERAIGVILTGELDDGAAGLAAISSCGGAAVVQDPGTAESPSMPLSALATVPHAHCLPLSHIGQVLVQLVSRLGDETPAGTVPTSLVKEQDVYEGRQPLQNLMQIGTPSPLTCPDCGGNLTELKDSRPLRYRCHTGHAYSARSLAAAQEEAGDGALWQALRSLREREMLLLRLATVAEGTGQPEQAATGRARAQHLREQAEQVRQLIQQDST